LNDYLTDIATAPQYANISASISIATAADDRPLFTFNFGPNESVVTSESIYRIGSVTKILTAYEALLHGLDLDSPVAKWIPEFAKEPYNRITLRGLAGHISGLTRECKRKRYHCPYPSELKN
jgi:CubicO group peptidase (beta-lactamase class C family)